MAEPRPIRALTCFSLRFILLAVPLLVLWLWLLMPYYVWFIGQISAYLLLFVMQVDVQAVRVEPGGFLNTGSLLVFALDRGRAQNPLIAQLVANVPPFVALVMATLGIGWRQRLESLGIGTAILGLGHVLFIVLSVKYAREIAQAPEIPTAIAQFYLTLPFLLWIVLAYRDKLIEYFADA